ncbi:unnamed protein product, partial [Iphiclides podalirius]
MGFINFRGKDISKNRLNPNGGRVRDEKLGTLKGPALRKGAEIEKLRANLNQIIANSNATPIGCHSSGGYSCCFCAKQFITPTELKRHNVAAHEDVAGTKYLKQKDAHKFNIKMDITGLRCKLCDSEVDNLELLLEHLKHEHKRKVFTDIKMQLIPFKFNDHSLTCYICRKTFPKFNTLRVHMNEHYSNYKCPECGAGFVCQSMLHAHAQIHKLGTFRCDFCPKVFATYRKKKSHEKGVHPPNELKSKCSYCDERFKHYRQKERHMAEAHESAFPPQRCEACGKTFYTRSSLSIHVKRYHLVHRPHKCPHCEKHFFSMVEVRLHLPTHTGQKNFKCDICHKAYSLRKTLTEHMRIHLNDRRHKCERCGQAFIQRATWRGHMRAKHGEQV